MAKKGTPVYARLHDYGLTLPQLNAVDLLVAGKNCAAAAAEAATLAGVGKVLHAEADDLEHQLAEPLAALVVSLAGGYDVLAAPASTGRRGWRCRSSMVTAR